MRELSLRNCRLDKRYDIYDELSRGSYAEIFVARDILASPSSSHNLVVIKALNVFLQDDLDPDLERTLVENFQNEAIALDRVRHPNIISRLGHGTARDLAGTVFHYLVLEFMEGGDLQKAARERNLSLKTALTYVEQVCAGLRHAHRNGVIHRDIKPQNLLLTKDRETVKIADFGVARMHYVDTPITRVGTNVYAPPEHSPLHAGTDAVMTVSALTPAADIYSLAKSVYALLTCETPRYFANQQITELPLTVRNEEWADAFLPVLRRATASEPGDRYQTVDEFWSALARLRRIAAESETTTHVRPKLHETPQAHVARGYSPLAPQKPRFHTSRDLKSRHPLIAARSRIQDDAGQEHPYTPPAHGPQHYTPAIPADNGGSAVETTAHGSLAVNRRQRPRFRRLAAFLLVFAVFAGALYGTSVYLRGLGFVTDFSNPFITKTGRANTDINLRPEPNANNEPIGLVTKNSRVRIVKTQNNWYQVDVIEQGRERETQLPTSRGWLNGKYVDLD